MANIIDARVRQKTATLSEWNSSDLVLLDGEQAFVLSDNGMPINFKIGDGTKRFSELPFWIEYDQGQYINVDSNSLPTPSANVGYSLVGSGTYTQSGGPDIVVPSGNMGVLSWDGSVWSLSQSVEMPDSSAKIAEWEAGTYEQNEVVSVDGIIYRALETTNDEPPSVKWEVIGGSSKIKELDRRVSFFDRPDIPYEHYLVGADMGVIDRLLSEKRDLDGLKPDGFYMYMIDRPDLGVIIIVDKDWRLISHTGH